MHPFVRLSGRLRPRQRGAVFLTCIVMVSLLVLTASSMSLASVDQLEIARDEAGGLQAELMAESALAFSLRQLALDPEWEGTGDVGIPLGETGSFQVQTAGEGAGGGVIFRMIGTDGEATAMLEAEVLVEDGGPGSLIESCGLVTLGGDFDANNVNVDAGDVLIVDVGDGVRDYSAGADDWVDPGLAEPIVTINNFHVDGALCSFEGVDGPNVSFAEAAAATAPVRTPRFDLDWFLEPNDDIQVYTTGTLKNVTTSKTVVINVPAGTHISLDNCKFYGGLVVYSEDTHEARDAHRNTMEWKKCTFGKETNPGAVPALGVLAPAAHVTHSHTQNSGYGLFYLQSADHLNAVTITAGAMMVVDAVGQMNAVDITFDDSIWDGQFDPFLDWGQSEASLLSVAEYYPE